jgi:hypothetical protein
MDLTVNEGVKSVRGKTVVGRQIMAEDDGK